MSVIVELQLAPEEFELGRIMALPAGVTVELETMVPAGEASVPFFWLYDDDRERVVDTVRAHPSVDRLVELDSFPDRSLYELTWTVERDLFFEGLRRNEGHVLGGIGMADAWRFELRFASNDALAAFQTHCENARLETEVNRVYNPTRPGAGPWFGLTGPQREALIRAVRDGYYSIPRTCTTQDLAEAFDISDQAVTERLRRGINTLVTNTLMVDQSDE